jgi:hypothetical protein
VTTAGFNLVGSGSASIASNINLYGNLLVNTTDSLIVGSGASKIDLTYINGAVATFTSGTVMIYGKLSASNLTKTTVNGANIFIDPKGFTATDYSFRVTTGGGTNPFTFTSGTITILNPNATAGANAELAMSASVAPVISGSALFVLGQGAGTVASAAGFRISLNSVSILNHLTINTGTVGVVLLTNVTLNGTLTVKSSGTLSGGSFLLKAPRYLYNGDVAQVTGTIIPDTVKVVTVDNPLGVTASKALAITDTLYLVSGTLSGPYTAAVTITGGTGVEENGTELPAGFALGQNYPNPFNPSTTISFSLAERGTTLLTVYDVLGREVGTLINGTLEAGTHAVTWDAAGVAGGVYYYTLRSGASEQTRKMLLLK